MKPRPKDALRLETALTAGFPVDLKVLPSPATSIPFPAGLCNLSNIVASVMSTWPSVFGETGLMSRRRGSQ